MIKLGPNNDIILEERYSYEGTPVYLLPHGTWKSYPGIDTILLMQHNLIRVRAKKVTTALYEQSGGDKVWFFKMYMDQGMVEQLGL